jgi:MFS family permease
MAEQRQAGIVQGIVLSLVTFLPIMATVSLAPGMPLFLDHFKTVPHVSMLVPMLITVPAVLIAITSPFAGALSDAVGRKRILLAAMVLYGVCGMAPLVLDSIYALLVSRVGVGVAEGMLMTVGKTLVGDYYAGERRQRWVGYQGGIDACLGSLTWLLGGVLASGSWRGPFLLYTLSVPMFFAVLWLLWEPERPTPAAQSAALPATRFPWSTMSVVFGITLFTSLMYFSYPVNIAKALRELGVDSSTRVGVLTAIASLGTPLGALLYARSRVHSSPVLVGVALGCIGVAFLGIGLTHNSQVATAFGFLEQIGNGIAGAAVITWTLSCLPFEHRGRGMGLWSTFLVAGIFLSPMVFALIAGRTGGVATGFTYLGAVCVAAALLIGRLRSLRTLGAAAPT